MKTTMRIKTLTAVSSAAVLLALAGCGDREEVQTGAVVPPDAATQRSTQAVEETRQESQQAVTEARQESQQTLTEARQESQQAVQEAREESREAVAEAREETRQATEQAQQSTEQNALYGPREETSSTAGTREDHRTDSAAVLGAGAASGGSATELQQEQQQAAGASANSQQETALLTPPQADRDTKEAPRDASASMGAGAASTGASEASNDAQITSKVNSAMTQEERLRAANLEVEAKDGVVTLKGKVASEQAKERAAELARGVEGVQSVRNELEVDQQAAAGSQERTGAMGAGAASGAQASGEQDRSRGIGAAVNDAAITAKVNTGLSVDKRLSAMDIDVDTENGVVTLKGKAPTEEAKRHAEEIARNVQDVRSVQNQLQVESQAAAGGSQPKDTATMGAGGSDKR